MSRLNALVFLALVSQVKLEIRQDVDGPSGTLQEIRKKWGARELVRDLDHIKEDVKKMTRLQELGEIKTDEAIFYFFRMHDFDDNSKLDGLELATAMKHTMDHSDTGSSFISDADLTAAIDSFLEHDENRDGYITYAEIRKFTSSEGQ
ncbi:multiple coagulation factor deficiency protein 2 homolog [Centruroides sculpturatus]|uniref:multiple coagulation factor deficiency protein 2 homolog n=1 Tax=Centruroides sculpturatus TaxID=218467 RepID=UPI000C6CE004|nr:multiple coagulation factor deficiency protein 2 homolog [Centruroides sculpturatus]